VSDTVEKPRLGRGLESLIPKSFLAKGRTILTLPLSEVYPNPLQPRLHFNEEELRSLSDSIKQYGLNQPVLVRRVGDRYELIAGERRFRASMLAGMPTIPAIVKEVTDRESLMLALIENLERSDLNAIEEAKGYERLMNEFGMTHQQLADSFMKSRSNVTNTLRLLKLPVQVQQGLSESKLSPGHARSLLSLETDEDILREYERLMTGQKDNVRELEKRVSKLVKKPITKRKSEVLNQVESALSAWFEAPVEVKGTAKKGKIIISYKSAEELAALQKRMA
jgi:ParB family transcriptional regulator, chromosome partitioning protein